MDCQYMTGARSGRRPKDSFQERHAAPAGGLGCLMFCLYMYSPFMETVL